MSIFKEFSSGAIDSYEFTNAFNYFERETAEDLCFSEGTKQGDCNKCPYIEKCNLVNEEGEEE